MHGLYGVVFASVYIVNSVFAYTQCIARMCASRRVFFADLHKCCVGGLVRLRGVDHQVHESLSRNWGAQTHRHQFGELGLYLRVHVNHLHVTATESTPEESKQRTPNTKFTHSTSEYMSAKGTLCLPGYSLSHVAFGGGVEGGHLHCTRVLWSHLKQHLLKGLKLTALCVHIILIDLKIEKKQL